MVRNYAKDVNLGHIPWDDNLPAVRRNERDTRIGEPLRTSVALIIGILNALLEIVSNLAVVTFPRF